MLLQACLNGMRLLSEHPAIPRTPSDLAAAGRAAVRAGAQELHVHPRSADGTESLLPEDVDAAMTALREACPGTAIGLTTNQRIVPNLAQRRACIDTWRVRPDFASVNIGEPHAPSVIGRMAARGIPCEAGLATVDDAHRYLAERARGMWVMRVMIEPDADDVIGALAQAEAILDLLGDAARAAPVMMHGFEASAWPLLDRARAFGLSMRVGLEDTLHLRDGSLAPDNAALLRDV